MEADAHTVCGLSLDGLAVGCDELAGHHAEGTESLGEDVRLDVTVVVLARPDEATLGLNGLGNHVVDETVLVVDAGLLEGLLILATTAMRPC